MDCCDRASCNKRVKVEFRYGTCILFLSNASMTSPKAERLRLMFLASVNCFPFTYTKTVNIFQSVVYFARAKIIGRWKRVEAEHHPNIWFVSLHNITQSDPGVVQCDRYANRTPRVVRTCVSWIILHTLIIHSPHFCSPVHFPPNQPNTTDPA